ncbi:MAG: hypothetical protein RID23_16270 [Roseovarius sp.]
MASATKTLEKMEQNPQGDWKVSDFEKVCRYHDIECDPPSGGGSHYKVTSPHLEGILTVPAKRPIKAIYVRKFVSYVAAHLEIQEEEDE